MVLWSPFQLSMCGFLLALLVFGGVSVKSLYRLFVGCSSHFHFSGIALKMHQVMCLLERQIQTRLMVF